MARRVGAICFTLVLLFALNSVKSELSEEHNSALVIDFQSHSWVNETLIVNGSSTIKPDVASWEILDVNSGVIRLNGSYLSSVVPISENNWNWTIDAPVNNISCLCRLVVNVGVLEVSITVETFLYIGEGPHNPDIRLASDVEGYHSEWIDVDLEGGSPNNGVYSSTIEVELCSASAGECDSDFVPVNSSIEWQSSNQATLNISLEKPEIIDGQWLAKCVLIDAGLSESIPLEYVIRIDRNDPVAVIVGEGKGKEFSELLIDGSSSSDGYWSENLQFAWLINPPSGQTYFASEPQIKQNVLHLTPEDSGLWVITLQVVDVRGRSNDAVHQILVEDVPARITMNIDGFALDNGDQINLALDSPWRIKVAVNDSLDDLSDLSFKWVVSGNIYHGDTLNLRESNLEAGEHYIELEISTSVEQVELGFTVVIPDESNDESSRILLWISLVLIVSIPIILLRLKLNSSRNSKSTKLPKWQSESENEETQ